VLRDARGVLHHLAGISERSHRVFADGIDLRGGWRPAIGVHEVVFSRSFEDEGVRLRPRYRAGRRTSHRFFSERGKGSRFRWRRQAKDPNFAEGLPAKPPFVFKRAGKLLLRVLRWLGANRHAGLCHRRTPDGTVHLCRQGDGGTPRASTQHGSVVQFKGKWYVLYHTSELSNGTPSAARCALTS